MTISIEDLAIIYPEQLLLEFSEREQETAWRQSQNQTPAEARWRTYLNYLCLNSFLTYFQEDADLAYSPQIWQHENLFNLWQLVNGTAIALKETRLVLIPQESTDSLDELRVPREWVDLPQWAGHYYLGVEIDLSQRSLRIWGYTTHQQLKQLGARDPIDETYALGSEALRENIDALWLDIEFNLQTALNIQLLPVLEAAEAHSLLERLTQPDVITPRLTLSFAQWGALIAEEHWRNALYERQQQINRTKHSHESTENTMLAEPAIALSQWFAQMFTCGWQSLDSAIATKHLAYSFRTSGRCQFTVEGVKLLDLGMQLGDRACALLIGITPETEDKVSIRVQLHPAGTDYYLPTNICLTLLSKSDRILQEFRARGHDELIQLKRFTCKRGSKFRIKVALDGFKIVEDFIVDVTH